ncbi:MAG: hypothetical protein KGD63_13275 [Candidatus Lokiarchaeota archaeon]|nr:hypothetical protein [Candidatus Lokiarchaeota archaeon]
MKEIFIYKSNDIDFNNYVYSLKGKFIAIQSFKDIKFRSRFTLQGKAINPDLKNEELIPKFLYIYPDDNPTKIFSDILSKGIQLKSLRTNVFIPLLILRNLTKKEVNAILKIVEIKEMDLKRLYIFLNELDIRYNIIKELHNNRYVLEMRDPQVSDTYRVLVNEIGRIFDVDFCFHEYQNLYLSELIMIVREAYYINHLSGFHY